ncbi:MAG: invasion regulator SirB1 [Buchnera aphidicola (Chaetogeoica yunlongensis)]
MKRALDFDFSELSLFESICSASKFIRSDFPVKYVVQKLESMIKETQDVIMSEQDTYFKLKRLIKLFYRDWKFECACGVYKLSDTLWLDYVLNTCHGTAVSLGIIFLYLAKKFNLNVEPVIFPTQLILSSHDLQGNVWFINPLNGETLNKRILRVWLQGSVSPTAELYDNYLSKAKSLDVVRKMLDILKIALMEEKNMELALNVSNLLLKINPKDPYEIRDRGLIYAQLECNHVALADLIYFIKHCPEDPISEILKIQVHSMEQKTTILH